MFRSWCHAISNLCPFPQKIRTFSHLPNWWAVFMRAWQRGQARKRRPLLKKMFQMLLDKDCKSYNYLWSYSGWAPRVTVCSVSKEVRGALCLRFSDSSKNSRPSPSSSVEEAVGNATEKWQEDSRKKEARPPRDLRHLVPGHSPTPTVPHQPGYQVSENVFGPVTSILTTLWLVQSTRFHVMLRRQTALSLAVERVVRIPPSSYCPFAASRDMLFFYGF